MAFKKIVVDTLYLTEKETVESESVNIRNIFSRSVRDNDITTMDGRVREGDGEFFGWRDGISQPGCEYVLCETFPTGNLPKTILLI